MFIFHHCVKVQREKADVVKSTKIHIIIKQICVAPQLLTHNLHL